MPSSRYSDLTIWIEPHDPRNHPPLSQGKDTVAYFEGTPMPTSVLLTAVLAFAAWQGRVGEDLY